MALVARRVLLTPFWLAQVFSQEKFFARNPVIGGPWLNEHGLRTARVVLANRLTAMRRRRVARLGRGPAGLRARRLRHQARLSAPDLFRAVVDQVRALCAPAREMVEGDTITRRIALDPAVLRCVPAARRLLAMPLYQGLVRYIGASAAAPMTYIQTMLGHVRPGPADPQTELHTDTFHPTVKAWLFLNDVAEDAMPFVYVPGSHRVTPQRLQWERRMSIAASRRRHLPKQRLVRAISPETLPELKLPQPRAFGVPASTLVVADTFGFHARERSRQPTMRVEVWASGRRNPFLPWSGLDPWSIGQLAARKPLFYWKSLELLAACGLGRQRWLPRPGGGAFDPV